jgi:hypothetical protein
LLLALQPFIYVENIGADGGLIRAAQELVENIGRLTGGKSRVTRDILPLIQVPVLLLKLQSVG